MTRRPSAGRALVYGVIATAMLAVPSCAGVGVAQHLATYQSTTARKAIPIDKKELLNPAHKYYGVFVPNAPDNITTITDRTNPNSVTSQTGKQPNMVLYYQAWDNKSLSDTAGVTNFDTTGASNACAQGLLPMMTWESWSTTDTNPTEGVSYAQPKFSLNRIISGDFDNYIRATANAIAALPCPLAIRLDQEQNGYWYPWGFTTKGMVGSDQATPARYIQMWRHVWRIFQAQGATNVLWVWSPNFIRTPKPGATPLAASYPGDKYVDWVGIDGYYYNDPTATFANLFNPTIVELKTFAASKPWLIAETGVGGDDLTTADQVRQVTNLLTTVAIRARFNGLIYFDQSKQDNDRADWRLTPPAAKLAAFKAGIDKPIYGAGKPGTRP